MKQKNLKRAICVNGQSKHGSRGDSTAGGAYVARSEFNADGIDVGFAEPETTGFESPEPLTPWGALGLGTSCSSANPNCITCYVNGFEWDCNRVNFDLVRQCPNNDCGPQSVDGKLRPLTTDPNTGRLVYGHWERVDITIDGERTRGNPRFKVDGVPVTLGGAFITGIGQGITNQKKENPQNTGFNMGKAAAFNDDQKRILNQVYNRINEKDCRDFINKVLAENRVARDRNTLDKLLARANVNAYYRDYTNTQLGVTMDEMIDLRDAFENRGDPAVTVGDRMIFLGALAFQREGRFFGTNIDTATITVHELLHVAGLDDPQVQNLNRQIHENCGFTGMRY